MALCEYKYLYVYLENSDISFDLATEWFLKLYFKYYKLLLRKLIIIS